MIPDLCDGAQPSMPGVASVPREHRWSGWPGAFCLDCFAEDVTEACVTSHAHAAVEPTPDKPMGVEAVCEQPPCQGRPA